MTDLTRVKIATDGACKGNPGPGGWGALIRSGAHEKEISGGETLTTNNRMELWQELLEAIKPHRIDWTWVKGHAGDPDNERADTLASDAALIAARSRA